MKVFQIGFNRCGTLSLCDFFAQNGHKSVHWDNQKWDINFIKNHTEGNLLCYGFDDVVLWSDIKFVQRQFQVFAEQYPNSKFIYNIRNIDDWLESRENWYSSRPYFSNLDFGHILNNKIDIIQYWKSEWFYHKKVVEEYFVGDKSNRLLVYNIDTDSSDKIVNFLPELEFTNLDFPHKHKSKND
jgi:hypothetical protein